MNGRTNEERLVAVETTLGDVRADVTEMKDSVKTLNASLWRRPSWAIVTFITLSTSLNVGLIVALSNHH